MKPLHWRILCLITGLLTLAGCSPAAQAGVPTAAVSATQTMNAEVLSAVRTQAVSTALAALTAQVTPTQTPTATLTPLPAATVLPTLTPLPTATPSPKRPTPTATPAQTNYVCTIEDLEPETGKTFLPGAHVDGVVELKNTGDDPWEKGEILFMYTSGTRLQKQDDAVLLTSRVGGDETIELRVDFVAPDKPGVYKTTWALRRGMTYFCPVHFQMTVKN